MDIESLEVVLTEPHEEATASAWAANASFSSIRSIRDSVKPARSSASFDAGTGPSPIAAGSSPASPRTSRSSGRSPSPSARDLVVTTHMAAASGDHLAAELNGYPGPSHVLELADKLELTTNQRANVKAQYKSMKAEAMPLGSKLIEQEAELDGQFANRIVTSESLKASTAAAAVTQGELRQVHLKYHLSMIGLLSGHQMQRYAELRGYADNQTRHHHH